MRKLQAQAETLRPIYLRRNEHDENRAHGGRGFGRKQEEAADVSRAGNDV
jgi:hypothetical protein